MDGWDWLFVVARDGSGFPRVYLGRCVLSGPCDGCGGGCAGLGAGGIVSGCRLW